MVTGYQLSKTIHKKNITRRDGNWGRGRVDTQQGRRCQRVALPLDEGKDGRELSCTHKRLQKIHHFPLVTVAANQDGF